MAIYSRKNTITVRGVYEDHLLRWSVSFDSLSTAGTTSSVLFNHNFALKHVHAAGKPELTRFTWRKPHNNGLV